MFYPSDYETYEMILSQINIEFPELQRTQMQDFYLFHVDTLPSTECIIDDDSYNAWLANVLEYYQPLPSWLNDRYSIEFQLFDSTSDRYIDTLYTFVCSELQPNVLEKTKEREKAYTEIVKLLNNNYSVVGFIGKIVSIPTLVEWILDNDISKLYENRSELFNYLWNENIELYKLVSIIDKNVNFSVAYDYYREYMLVDLLAHQHELFSEDIIIRDMKKHNDLRKQCTTYAIKNNYRALNYFCHLVERYREEFPGVDIDTIKQMEISGKLMSIYPFPIPE